MEKSTGHVAIQIAMIRLEFGLTHTLSHVLFN